MDVSEPQRNGDDLTDYLSQKDDVVIATTLKGGGEIRTEIWAVVVDGADTSATVSARGRNGTGAPSAPTVPPSSTVTAATP